MKKVLLSVLFLSYWFCELPAQNSLLQAFEISSDTSVNLAVPVNYWQILKDKAGKLTINDVTRSTVSEEFRPDDSKAEGLDYSVHYYWIRYRIKNVMSRPVNICLTNPTDADQSDFYVIDETGNRNHFTTGILYPGNKKDGLKKINSIPFIIGEGKEILVYNRIKNQYYYNKPDYLSVTIGLTNMVIDENYVGRQSSFSKREFAAAFAGILLFACLFSLFFYSIVRDKVYLYYSLFLFYFSGIGEFLSDVVFPNHPAILLTIEYFIHSLGILLFVQFIRYFLKTFEKYPRWDTALKTIAIVHPLSEWAAFFIEPHLAGKWNGSMAALTFFVFVVGLFMILITFLKYLRSQGQSLVVLKIAAIPAAIFWSFGIGMVFFFGLLSDRFDVPTPPFMIWLLPRFNTFNMLCVLWFVVGFSWVLLLQFIQLRKENIQQALDKERLSKEREMERRQIIEQKKIELEKEVDERTYELKQSMIELKSTQAQLIQSEKMASLGELTAGIAHEIQNPLNFVNNFSEVNKELVDELKSELATGNMQSANEIADTIKDNQDKINQHGKRADAIVKGMLQHSRISGGQRELTDINALADEYLRLAYHGLRAKDKSFNAKIETNFDPAIGKINIVPQEIGRVILNLINNAFYAVSEKQKYTSTLRQPQDLALSFRPDDTVGRDYEPTVIISTKKLTDKIEIKVSDNGIGISQKLLDKIFQPFFTTKPTGQGTGLGLSLAYDTITKGHGGKISVVTNEGSGSEFIIDLPLS